MEDIRCILEKFEESDWDLIAIPSKAYLNNTGSVEDLLKAVEKANVECGTCGCEFDHLYKRCIELLK